MARSKQIHEVKKILLYVDATQYENLKLKVGNVSKWVRTKMDEELTTEDDKTKLIMEKLTLENKMKEHELKLSEIKKDIISLDSKIKSQENITESLETIRTKKTSDAIKILSRITDEERRLEVAKVHADLITKLGKKVDYAELLEKLKR